MRKWQNFMRCLRVENYGELFPSPLMVLIIVNEKSVTETYKVLEFFYDLVLPL